MGFSRETRELRSFELLDAKGSRLDHAANQEWEAPAKARFSKRRKPRRAAP